MIKLQKAMVLAWAIVICAMGIYPPWVVMAQSQFRSSAIPYIKTYDWLWTHWEISAMIEVPQRLLYKGYLLDGPHIDIVRLLIQWICVSVLAISIVYSLKKYS
jgi:hypothetical protein